MSAYVVFEKELHMAGCLKVRAADADPKDKRAAREVAAMRGAPLAACCFGAEPVPPTTLPLEAPEPEPARARRKR